MAPKIALLHAVGCAIATLIGAAVQTEELAAAIAAEGAACSASGGLEGCDLHLLQLHAQGLGGVAGDGGSRGEAPDLLGAQEPVSDEGTGYLAEEAQGLGGVAGGDGSHGDFTHENAAAAEKPDLLGAQEQTGGMATGSPAAEAPKLSRVSEHPSDARAEEVPSRVDVAGAAGEQGVPEAVDGARAADAAGVTAHGVLEVPSSADVAGAEAVEVPGAMGEPSGAEAVHAAAAGRCSAQDEVLMKRMGGGSHSGAFPAEVAVCGRHAYKWFRFHSDAMATCISKKSGISAHCASCFGEAGQYGFDHCKTQCLFGKWCSNLCMGCTGKHNAATESCVGLGIAVPQPERC